MGQCYITRSNFIEEEKIAKEIFIAPPFTENVNYLSNMLEGDNFFIAPAAAACIANGSTSFRVDYGTSYGYIKFTTPDYNTTASVTCWTGSQELRDYGGVYIGTNIYKPRNDEMKNGLTDNAGEWIFIKSGIYYVEKTYSYDCLPNTTYYLNFCYTKGGTGYRDSDRFYIRSIKFTTVE